MIIIMNCLRKLNQKWNMTEQKLVDDASCLPLWFGQNYTLVRPYVDGYSLNPMGLPALNQVTIEPH